MTLTEQLLVVLWLISFSDGVAAALAARQAFRLRAIAQGRAFEWLTAFSAGLFLYSVEVFISVFNGIVSGPPVSVYSTHFILIALGGRLIRTFGMWVIVLTLLNGGSPGITRRAVEWILNKFGLMDRRPRPLPLDSKVDNLTSSVERLRETAEAVADDLAASRHRADDVQGKAGEAADAASRSPGSETNLLKAEES